MLLALPTNARIGWKLLTVTNTLAYYHTELKVALKSLILPTLGNSYSLPFARGRIRTRDLDIFESIV
jgi:hypothetical protein